MNATLARIAQAGQNNAAAYTARGSKLAPKTITPASATTREISFRDMLAVIETAPEGSFALRQPSGKVDFLKVEKTNKGKTFIKRLVGAPGTFATYPLPMRIQMFAAIHISADPLAAAKTFADEHGVCARCHSPLTDEASRTRGLGPVCAKKF